MTQTTRPHGMTLIEVIVVLIIIAVLVAVLLPAIGTSTRTTRRLQNNTQLRGIHQGFITFAQSNEAGGQGGYYPGLDASGDVVPDGPLTGHSGDGDVPAARMWMLLNGNFFTPDYMVGPADDHAVKLVVPAGGPIPPVIPENFSYAFQSLAGHPAERSEWKETLNTAAPIAGDRAIGTGPADISSVDTSLGSGDWRGLVVRNDNTTSFVTHHVFTDTKYGREPVNPVDDIFADDPAAADAYLVHDDATTAYSAK